MKPKSMVPGSKAQQGSWSWLDRVQTKLESLYETEQAGTVFFQETSRMLESQVTKVGTNVKRFYSDFVRELLLPLDGSAENQGPGREKAPAQTSTEEVPGRSQPGSERAHGSGEGGDLDREDEQEEDVRAQAGEKDASDMSVSEFELLQPPLFQAPQVEETHEDLRVKEGVTKLHLKLQEMQRLEADQAPMPDPISRANEERAPEAPAPTFVQADSDVLEPQTEGPDAVLDVVTASEVRQALGSARYGSNAVLGASTDGPDASANKELTHVASDAELSRAESDAVDLEFASEAEAESKREEDFLSGNESDRSEQAKWYGAKAGLTQKESGESTKGWFDWELV